MISDYEYNGYVSVYPGTAYPFSSIFSSNSSSSWLRSLPRKQPAGGTLYVSRTRGNLNGTISGHCGNSCNASIDSSSGNNNNNIGEIMICNSKTIPKLLAAAQLLTYNTSTDAYDVDSTTDDDGWWLLHNIRLHDIDIGNSQLVLGIIIQ